MAMEADLRQRRKKVGKEEGEDDHRANDDIAQSPRGTAANDGKFPNVRKEEEKEKHKGRPQRVVLAPYTYWLTRIAFCRSLAFIYLVAFAVSYWQNKELIGTYGLTPTTAFLSERLAHFEQQERRTQHAVKKASKAAHSQFWSVMEEAVWSTPITSITETTRSIMGLAVASFGEWKHAWDFYTQTFTLLWVVCRHSEQCANMDIDPYLDALALFGMTLACIILIRGGSNFIAWFSLWLTYHSLCNVGQHWFGFGWESQLLELGFLACWLCPMFDWFRFRPLPPRLTPPWVSIWGNRWKLCRLMLGAGLIKIRGDQCWRDLTCMDYFYETQPVPNPLTWYIHWMPWWWHRLETMSNHVVELGFPFLLFVPHRHAWHLNGVVQMLFQCILISTGNLSFLNWLSMVPAIMYFDDRFLQSLFSRHTATQVREIQQQDECWLEAQIGKSGATNTNDNADARTRASAWLKRKWYKYNCAFYDPRTPWARRGLTLAIGILISYLSLPIVNNLLSRRQLMNSSFDRFRLVNTYGAFGSVTKIRTEIVIQGTRDPNPADEAHTTWMDYEFNCKPGRVDRRPCLISPYHYRLDWLMWFAAFQRYENNPWLLHLMGKMMDGDPIVDSLLEVNPFSDKNKDDGAAADTKGGGPPLFVRALHYKYTLTRPGSEEAGGTHGHWWHRELIGEYVPIINKHMLGSAYEQMGWLTREQTRQRVEKQEEKEQKAAGAS